MTARKVIRRDRRKFTVGDFRTPVVVLKSSTTPSPDGGISMTLTPQFTVFMNEVTISPGAHRFAGVNVAANGNQDNFATHIFTTRYRADLSAEFVLDRGRTRFEILEIQNLEGRGEYLVIRCRELGANDKEVTKQ